MLEGMHIDAAFCPSGSKAGQRVLLGLDWFMRHTDTDVVFPMHMQDQYDLYDRLMEEESAWIIKPGWLTSPGRGRALSWIKEQELTILCR